MIYFDTAYLAKCYLNEPGSASVRSFAAASDELVASCVIARAELAAVFHRQFREGHLSQEDHQIVARQYQADLAAGVWEWLPLDAGLWPVIESRFREMPRSVFLRGADAIHLSCASYHGFSEVFTNDRHMLAACGSFGVKGRNVIE
ncbi:MAG: type II toxin-antitoxin system VapC family toxin [Coraliomargarita sp.]